MTTVAHPKPQLTSEQKAAQARRVMAALEQRATNELLARAVVRVLDRVKKPFQ